jgi:hypothetical protein
MAAYRRVLKKFADLVLRGQPERRRRTHMKQKPP